MPYSERESFLSTQYHTVLLEHLQVCITKVVSEQELMSGRVEVPMLMARMDARELVARLCYFMAGQKEVCEQRWPADWWEALKQRFAPAWFVQRWPVREAVFAVDAWRLWQNTPAMPDAWKPEYRIVIPKPVFITGVEGDSEL